MLSTVSAPAMAGHDGSTMALSPRVQPSKEQQQAVNGHAAEDDDQKGQCVGVHHNFSSVCGVGEPIAVGVGAWEAEQ